jgi:hypothetical protein
MKPIIIAAILLVFLFLMPMALAFQQTIHIPRTTSSQPSPDFIYLTCEATSKSTEPGSGGGGQGVI